MAGELPSIPPRCRGLSLMELLVAMALGVLLSLAMAAVYIQGSRYIAVQDELGRMRENGRFAANLLRRELALAGFFSATPGADNLSPLPPGVDCGAGNWALDMKVPLDLADDVSEPVTTVNGVVLNCLERVEARAGVQPHSDIVVAKRTASDATLSNGIYHSGVSSAEETQWYLRLADNGAQRSWLYVGDGGRFPGGDTVAGSGIDFWEYQARIFYVRSYSRAAGDGIPSLCVEQLIGNAMASDCLVEGVEDLQLEFGIDTDADGTPDVFRSSPSAGELKRAVVARFYLLMRSVGAVAGHHDGKTYQLGRKRVAAKLDGFYRQVVSGVVLLRNTALAAR